mmetsp:Transcript_14079/g.12431  ORF Transcript_14079/g.12431 Transcript_14079/m.12431 type:complete len:247 (+) Transcript_14079:924-1664(+)
MKKTNEQSIWTITSLGDDVTHPEIKFIRGKVVYPNTVGYTGYAIQKQKTIFYLDPKYRDDDYIDYDCKIEDEIDNFYQEPEVSSALFLPILDHKGDVQGALQLINFIHGTEALSQRQINEIETTCEIIGSSLYNLREITNIMLCSSKLTENIQSVSIKITQKLEKYLTQVEGDIIESIKTIQKLVKDFVSTKKMQLFKDKVLMSTYAEYEIEETRKEKVRIKIIRKNELKKILTKEKVKEQTPDNT